MPKGIEVRTETGRFRDGLEPGIEIDGRPVNRVGSKRLTVEAHVREFVFSDLLHEFADGGRLEGNLLSTDDVARFRTGIGCVDAFSGGATEIVFGLHIFEVERKAENIFVRYVMCQYRRRPRDSAECRSGTEYDKSLKGLTPG